MLPAIGTIIFAYVVARLIQVPIEYQGPSKAARGWIIALSAVAILAAGFSWLDLVLAARTAGKAASGYLGQ